MTRVLTGVVIISVFLSGVVLCGECESGRRERAGGSRSLGPFGYGEHAVFILLIARIPAISGLPGVATFTWPTPPKGMLEYADSSGLWRVVTDPVPFHTDIWQDDPWPGIKAMYDEGGVWYSVKFGLRPGVRVVLYVGSQVVLVDKKGGRIVGVMRFLRSPEPDSPDVWDVWRAPLVVREGAFMGKQVGPCVATRFSDEVNWKNVERVEVHGVRVLHEKGSE